MMRGAFTFPGVSLMIRPTACVTSECGVVITSVSRTGMSSPSCAIEYVATMIVCFDAASRSFSFIPPK